MQKAYKTGLKVFNTITDKMEQFIPLTGKRVNWYICGPTVYSQTHLGHARNYICSDMIRKTMRHYFGYHVYYCMNITNIDDKIINKAILQKQPFEQFASKWENQYFKDMKEMGNQIPDVILRVSQYVPEIIQYIKKLINLGMAYPSNQSVYFDITQYSKNYKIGIFKIQQSQMTQEQQKFNPDKKDQKDFVLWKKAKENQPSWTSPWGLGRPGWHIECSTLSHIAIGPTLDIHSGGVDLKFPHHQNQIAQCCAYNQNKQWTKYFIHTGHLHIYGRKMSKSLKNFLTVKQILQKVGARVLRLFFSLHRYNSIIDFNPQTSFTEALNKDRKFKQFFLKARTLLQTLSINKSLKMKVEQFDLMEQIKKTQASIHQHLINNFNFPGVINDLDCLITKTNIYFSNQPKLNVISALYQSINYFFNILGIYYSSDQQGANSHFKEVIQILCQYRDKVRTSASNKDLATIFKINDQLRDEILPIIGVRLQDKRIGQPSIWLLDNPQNIKKDKAMKLQEAKKKQQQRKNKQEQKIRKMKIKPQEMFIEQKDKYSKWDEKGIPTHDKQGKQLKQKFRKKLQKQWITQQKLYKQNEYK